jgi:hypothetical protein
LVVNLYPGHGLVGFRPFSQNRIHNVEPAPSTTASERAGVHKLAQHNTATTIRQGKGWRTKGLRTIRYVQIVGLCVGGGVGFLAAAEGRGFEPRRLAG